MSTTGLLRYAGRSNLFSASSRIKRISQANRRQSGQVIDKPPPKEDSEKSTDVTSSIRDQKYSISRFFRKDLLPEVPITNLKLDETIEKVEKVGSFSVDLFLGKYDHDFLVYPDAVYDRHQLKQIKQQVAMVEQLYPQIWDDSSQLQRYNFHDLFRLSASEMMTIYEALGKSTENCWESQLARADKSLSIVDPAIQTKVTRAIISLITRNCLTYLPMWRSENLKLREHIPSRDIEFGGATELKEPIPPIGFCWTEDISTLGSMIPHEWQTYAIVGDESSPGIILKGKKSRVIHEESTENYLVYYRDKTLAEMGSTNDEDPNPASDPFIGCCIVNKSEINFGPVYSDSAGILYSDLDFDTVIPFDRLVFPAKPRDPTGVNVKALGQVASSAVCLGILKNALKNAYKHLLEKRSGLLTCDIVEKKIASITMKIFAIESMVYYVAGMYDGLKSGFDAHLETMILKILTCEYAHEVIRDIQLIHGSDMFSTSRLQDQINLMDAFLDGNIYNRLYLSTMGVLWYARVNNIQLNQSRQTPWFTGQQLKNFVKPLIERSDFISLDADILGQIHPSLHAAGSNLEYTIKRVKIATENLCMKYGQNVTAAQYALYSLSQIVIDSFLLTTMLARSSKSYCNGSKNSELDINLTLQFSEDVVQKVKLYIEQLNITPLMAQDCRTKLINEYNLKEGGYYAESPLDPNI